jgi:predicted nucleic acid-binding Zn ribbon protein
MRVESLRKQVLEDWRGLPDGSEKPDRCTTVADALKKLLPKLGLSDFLNEEQIRQAWKEVVGDFLAGHSAPVSIQRGVLIVQVLQPAIRYELDRTWKPEVLRKLRARFGEKVIREVRFR